MEELIIIYIIFSLTTALHACWGILAPTLERLKEEQPDNSLLYNVPITYLVFLSMSLLVAPLMLLPCIIPSMNDTFKDSLYSSVKD